MMNLNIDISIQDILEGMSEGDFIEFVKEGDKHFESWSTVGELLEYFHKCHEEYALECYQVGESCNSPDDQNRYFLEDQLYDQDLFLNLKRRKF